jgi:3-oxoacyl-[acyl-carrier-protein] synthase III
MTRSGYAAITGVGAWVPEYRFTNADLEKLVDTNADWILSRTGIAERRILKGEGLGTSHMAIKAVSDLLKHTDTDPLSVEALIFTSVNPDYKFPPSATLVCNSLGLKNAFGFDLNATCSGFIYALEIGRRFIESGAYSKVIVVASEMMSSLTDYTDRSSCILFGDAAAAVMLEPSEYFGIRDVLLKSDGSGSMNILLKSGGSACPVTAENLHKGWQYFWQDGKVVFKHAVLGMETACREVLSRNHLETEDIQWVIAHQANLRILESVAQRLELPMEKMLVNIEKYGNTSSASIPLCLYDFKDSFKPGNNLLLTAFGSGYTWGAVWLTWGN